MRAGEDIVFRIVVNTTGDPEKLREVVQRKLELVLGDSLVECAMKKPKAKKRPSEIFIEGPPPHMAAR